MIRLHRSTTIMTGLVFFLVMLFSSAAMLQAQSNHYTESLKYTAQKYYWGKNVRQDLPKALSLYRQAAERGDTEAQFIAGGMYFRGIGTDKNPQEAFKWLYKAALNGASTPQSQKILGQSFLMGSGVPQNYNESIQWYQKAAENGDRDAQNELAFLYYVGRGVGQDFRTAYKWFEKAAREGLVVAQYNVGIMWYTGNGVDSSDLIQAYSWLSLAAANGHQDASAASKYIETIISPSELQEAQKRGMQLYRQINEGQADTKTGE
ncbi:MAG: tetratricopeptide repeat protein [Desulfocapsaceae bacterium]|nr:tetratricopeptide repeat protein [Desulfocapsaceae bacterium]